MPMSHVIGSERPSNRARSGTAGGEGRWGGSPAPAGAPPRPTRGLTRLGAAAMGILRHGTAIFDLQAAVPIDTRAPVKVPGRPRGGQDHRVARELGGRVPRAGGRHALGAAAGRVPSGEPGTIAATHRPRGRRSPARPGRRAPRGPTRPAGPAPMTEPASRDSRAHQAAKRYIYAWGAGQAEGDATMRDLLGGKGAGLAEMTSAGLPVPPGFTITTEACNDYFDAGEQLPDGLWEDVLEAAREGERGTGKGFR